MAKIEYKDLPTYIAHTDGTATDTSVVNNIIDKSVASGTIKAADDSVKSWANSTFQKK